MKVSDFANPEIGDASPTYESWMKCVRDYVEFVKVGKTITECAKVVCDASSIYFYQVAKLRELRQ